MLTNYGLNNFLKSALYRPSDLGMSYASAGGLGANRIQHPIGSDPALLATLDNQGKIVTGRDRNGNVWEICVHGPGSVIVTDATPNDGVLDDDIDSIQLINTDVNRTRVVGSVRTSNQILTSGTVVFNRLFAQQGVKSIDLKGFILTQTVTPPNGGSPNSNTSIELLGGVRSLSFQGIDAPIDLATNSQPINVVIGDPNTPLRFKPSLRIDQIRNTVFDSTSTVVPTGPQVLPTVNIIINGASHSIQFVSATQAVVDPALAFLFPIVGTTGRTTIQTRSIDRLTFRGSAINTTASRSATPFQNGLSSMEHLGSADFGGNADALGLDVKGRVGGLRFARGLGSPVGVSTAATTYGTPLNEFGYPANGLVGGLVTGSEVGHVVAAPANTILQTPQNPNQIQTIPGVTNYVDRPGSAFSSAAIVTSGSQGKTTIVGNLTNSEIKAGTDYPSVVAGLQGARARSKISPIKLRGDLVDSVVSASYRPGANGYGTSGSVAGRGKLRGHFIGSLYNNGGQTILGNRGAGFYARSKTPSLAPPEIGKRVGGLLVR
ncbi:MAG: hypothetical protein SFX72_12625 [Isosphaeraceae bacterium]|nr:hypothetical protein [Isosphaeraceae bacterium]